MKAVCCSLITLLVFLLQANQADTQPSSSRSGMRPGTGGWTQSHRIQVGLERDSNIFETRQFPRPDMALRITINSNIRRNGRKIKLHGGYSGAVLVYAENGVENKWTHVLQLQASWLLRPELLLQGTLQGYFKFFWDNPVDFGQTVSDLRARIRLPGRWGVLIGWSTSRLDYRQSTWFDFTGRHGYLTFMRALRPSLAFEFTLRQSRLNFFRPAYELTPEKFIRSPGTLQRDHQTDVVLRLRHRSAWLTQIVLDWQKNRSNSYGYSFRRWRLQLIMGWPVTRRWFFRLASLFQIKRYEERIPPLLPLDLDVERT